MRKILTLIPAGEVYDHDCVRWYRAHDVQRSINHYHNIGDAFVHDSSLKLLDYDAVEDVNIRDFKNSDVDRYNAEFEYCFLRGSNYINEGMNWYRLPELLERLKIPVIAFGIGAQAPSVRPLRLSAETCAVLQAIAARCTTLGVRGAYTAEVLAGLGITNVRVIGCPTLFRNRDPELTVAVPSPDALRTLGFTLRREVSATYTSDVARYLAVHRETILALAGRFDLRLLAQGEVEEKKIVQGTEAQRAEALQALAALGWLTGADDPLACLYAQRLFYADVVADNEAMARSLDLVLGYRLHGNLLALANGVPAIYFTYDSRTAEFAETFAIPAFDVYAGRPFVLDDYLDAATFAPFNRAYRRGYAEMRAFLAENGIAHRLDCRRERPVATGRHAAAITAAPTRPLRSPSTLLAAPTTLAVPPCAGGATAMPPAGAGDAGADQARVLAAIGLMQASLERTLAALAAARPRETTRAVGAGERPERPEPGPEPRPQPGPESRPQPGGALAAGPAGLLAAVAATLSVAAFALSLATILR